MTGGAQRDGKSVERARPDIAEDDAERGEREEPDIAGVVRFLAVRSIGGVDGGIHGRITPDQAVRRARTRTMGGIQDSRHRSASCPRRLPNARLRDLTSPALTIS